MGITGGDEEDFSFELKYRKIEPLSQTYMYSSGGKIIFLLYSVVCIDNTV